MILAEPPPRGKKINPIVVREMQERRESLEEEIARIEAEISQCELDQANFKSAEESIRLVKRIGVCRTELRQLIQEWEQLSLALDGPADAVIHDK